LKDCHMNRRDGRTEPEVWAERAGGGEGEKQAIGKRRMDGWRGCVEVS
jgi:hypothetical protein